MAQERSLADRMVDLAMLYMGLAGKFHCRTPQALSKVTYTLREAGEDIPYLAVGTTDQHWYPAPTSKQKNWKWLKDRDLPRDIYTDDGFLALDVNKTSDSGWELVVTRSKRLDKKSPLGKVVLFKFTFFRPI